MNTFGKMVITLLLVICVYFIPAGLYMRDCGNKLEQCATESVDVLLSVMQAEKCITKEDYVVISELLYKCGYNEDFRLTVYYYEYSQDGEMYQYSISMEEICRALDTEGLYVFTDESYLQLEVPAYSPENILTRFLYSRKGIIRSVKMS